MIDFTNLQKMVNEKCISVQKHPTEDLYIYNYTQRAQFDKVWNNETLSCRGLIMDKNNKIVARPFKKFFNLSEMGPQFQLPAEDFLVTEKMDGSLGILYWIGDKPYIATRGSFISEQAIKGTQILQTKYKIELNRAWTPLFEIIYPSNRIVVDYAGMEDLVLLSIIETDSGIELPYKQIQEIAKIWEMPIVKKYDGMTDFSKLEQRPNSEGYVITFPSTKQRFKIKFDEYVRLHKIITGINARRIWELLSNNQPLDEILERVPDEFFKWVKDTKEKLEREFKEWEKGAKEIYETAIKLPTRKEQAGVIKGFSQRGIVFKMLDKKPYAEVIWKMIKPKHEVPFKMEI